MAIYHLSVKNIGRSSGRSAVGAVAYRAGEKLHNEHDGRTHDYTNRRGAIGAVAYRSGGKLHDGNVTHDFTPKGGIIYSEIMLPKHALAKFKDRETLWNAVEKAEKQHNARTAREVEIALPNELTTEQQIRLVQDYVMRNFVNEGMCADFSIHAGKHEHKNAEEMNNDDVIKKDNPHVHIMLTVRPLNDDGTWGAKSKKEYILDKNGNRIKLKSGEWKSRKINAVNWDDRETLINWREDWATTVNREFERLGIDERIDHRTLEAQGFEREPTIHVGRSPEREKRNQEIIKRNERFLPKNVAEYMNELQEEFKIVDNHLIEIAGKQREIDRLNHKIKGITERAVEITKKRTELAEALLERESMGFFKSKREINKKIDNLSNSEQNARIFFVRAFGVEVYMVSAEIQKIEQQKEAIHRKIEAANVEKLLDDRNRIIMEYHKQKILAEIRPDGREILSRIKPPPALLGYLSKENFDRIFRDLRPVQARILMEKRKVDRTRIKVNERIR